MKLLERVLVLVAALLVARPALVVADSDVTIWSCLPSSTAFASPSESPSTSTAPSETVEISSSTPDLSSTAEASTSSSVAACEGTVKPSSSYSSSSEPSSSEPSSSEPSSSVTSASELSSSSTSTALASTTSLAIPVRYPIGQVNATSLEWTIVWRRCNMPATRSPF